MKNHQRFVYRQRAAILPLALFAATLASIQRAGAQQSQESMPGMQMGQQAEPNSPRFQLPQDMRHPAPGNKRAQQETQSEQNSIEQQRSNVQAKPGPAADAQSLTHPTFALQEPESPGHRTGSNLPAPDLLGDLSKHIPLGLDHFLSMADKTNPTIQQAHANVRRSAGQALQAGLYPNPAVGYEGDQIRGGSYGGGENGAFVQQTIVLGGKLGLRRNIYEQQKRSDRIGVEEQTAMVHNDVTRAFYRALTAQAMVQARQRLLDIADDAVLTAHQLANVGQAGAPDILQAEVETEQSQIDFVNAQRQFIQEFQVLAAYAGAPALPLSPLTGQIDSLPAFDPEQQVAKIVSSSPAVLRARQEVAVAEARVKDAKREAVPDILLRAGEQYNGELVSENPNHSAGPQSFASATINLPLWNRNQGNVSAAGADVARAQGDLTRTQLFLKQQADPLAQSFLAASFEAQRYRTELIPRARRAYELYLTKYQQMAMAYPQVLISQRTFFHLQISYLRSLETAWTTRAALENFVLTGGLQMPTPSGTPTTTINLPNGGGSE